MFKTARRPRRNSPLIEVGWRPGVKFGAELRGEWGHMKTQLCVVAKAAPGPCGTVVVESRPAELYAVHQLRNWCQLAFRLDRRYDF